MISCKCDKHPQEPNGVCGFGYLYFGHEGWGEPYGRGNRCPNCDLCFSNSDRGLSILSDSKQKIEKWLKSKDSDTLLGETSFIGFKASYAIKQRLYPSFSNAIAKKNMQIRKAPICRSRFLFETEVAGVWQINQNSSRYELKPNFNKHPMEQGWTIDFKQLSADVDLQKPSCPICGSVMKILMHEGWVIKRDVGYGNERRPIRIYYLSCEHDSTTYRPNRPIKSNEDAPPFNVHPLEKDPSASFWHSEFRYLFKN